jgi:hypothetical protein
MSYFGAAVQVSQEGVEKITRVPNDIQLRR